MCVFTQTNVEYFTDILPWSTPYFSGTALTITHGLYGDSYYYVSGLTIAGSGDGTIRVDSVSYSSQYWRLGVIKLVGIVLPGGCVLD